MGIRSFVGGLVCAGVSGRPHRAAPTQGWEFAGTNGVVRCGSLAAGRDGARPLHDGGGGAVFPQRAANAQAALSEAGSAERAAGQFGFCPIPSECSTAHNVRKSDRHSARGYAGAASN